MVGKDRKVVGKDRKVVGDLGWEVIKSEEAVVFRLWTYVG